MRVHAKMCPECEEPVVECDLMGVGGWALEVPAERLRWAHTDGEPLCPVMASGGYVPALPVDVS